MRYVYLLMLSLMLYVLGIGGFGFSRTSIAQTDLVAYVRDSMKLDLKDFAKASRGHVETIQGEQHSVIEIALNVRTDSDVLPAFLTHMETVLGEQEDTVQYPSDEHGEIMDALRQKKVLAQFIRMTSGRRVKTRVIFVFLATDSDENVYYYQFG